MSISKNHFPNQTVYQPPPKISGYKYPFNKDILNTLFILSAFTPESILADSPGRNVIEVCLGGTIRQLIEFVNPFDIAALPEPPLRTHSQQLTASQRTIGQRDFGQGMGSVTENQKHKSLGSDCRGD